jgi:hypothetical protein
LITRAADPALAGRRRQQMQNLYSAVSAAWPREVAAAIVFALSTRRR